MATLSSDLSEQVLKSLWPLEILIRCRGSTKRFSLQNVSLSQFILFVSSVFYSSSAIKLHQSRSIFSLLISHTKHQAILYD